MPAEFELTDGSAERRFLVVWQDTARRELVHVGDLVVHEDADGRVYEYSYTPDAAAHPRFVPFRAFPDIHGTYRQPELFALFQNRVMSSRRPDYPQYLSALGLDHADPVELLARTGGRRATDTIQIVPAPVIEGGREVLHFPASGVRHVDPDGTRVAQLESGMVLQVRPDPDNDRDPRALLLDVRSGEPVGYGPGYLLDYVYKRWEQGAHVQVAVEQVNGPEVPWHLRVLCRMDVTRAHERLSAAGTSQH